MKCVKMITRAVMTQICTNWNSICKLAAICEPNQNENHATQRKNEIKQNAKNARKLKAGRRSRRKKAAWISSDIYAKDWNSLSTDQSFIRIKIWRAAASRVTVFDLFFQSFQMWIHTIRGPRTTFRKRFILFSFDFLCFVKYFRSSYQFTRKVTDTQNLLLHKPQLTLGQDEFSHP